MKSVAVNTTLLKSITVLHKTDFTTMGHYQLNLIQIHIIEKHGLNQVFSNVDIILLHYLSHFNMHVLG